MTTPRGTELAKSISLLPAHLQKFDIDPESGCWIYRSRRPENGYAMSTSYKGRKGAAYRLIYELLTGERVPSRWHCHHTCDNGPGGCVNPEHLEPLPPKSHNAISPGIHKINAVKTHCPRGHALEGDNLRILPNGWRACKTCRAQAQERYLSSHSKDELAAKRREHYAQNRERILAQKREWRARNRERRRETDRARYAAKKSEAS